MNLTRVAMYNGCRSSRPLIWCFSRFCCLGFYFSFIKTIRRLKLEFVISLFCRILMTESDDVKWSSTLRYLLCKPLFCDHFFRLKCNENANRSDILWKKNGDTHWIEWHCRWALRFATETLNWSATKLYLFLIEFTNSTQSYTSSWKTESYDETKYTKNIIKISDTNSVCFWLKYEN